MTKRLICIGAAAVAVFTLVVFGLLQNPYWIRGGDSEVYICIARRLAEGRGLRFNGQPVSLVPPGWPIVLAGVVKLSTSFIVLKLPSMLAMAGSLVVWFLVLVRFTTIARALLSVAIVALLPPVFQLTYWFHAEGAFCLLATLALLLALQINSGKEEIWRIALMCLLCGASLTMRWTGILFWPLIAGGLLQGELCPKLNRRWVAAFVSGALTLVVFVGLRWSLRVPADKIDPRFDATLSGAYDLVNDSKQVGDTLATRLLDADQWVSGLLYSRATVPFNATRTATRIAGGIAGALWLLTTCIRVARREWAWLGAFVYYAALCVNWPSPVARYMIPIAPLVLAGTFEGLMIIGYAVFGRGGDSQRHERGADWGVGLCAAAAGLILIPNLCGYAIDVWTMRARDFYSKFQGGVDETFIAASQLLRGRGIMDGELVVSRRFATPDNERMTNGWMRCATLLTDRAVMTMPDELSREPDARVAAWMRANGAKYYLYLPLVYVNGNFKFLTWNGIPVSRAEQAWRLYELGADGEMHRLALPEGPVSLKRLPVS